MQSGTPSSSQSSLFTSGKRRSNRSQRNEDALYDNTMISVASSLSKLVESHTAGKKELKFKEFHEELDKILQKLPFMEALKFNLDTMERANHLLNAQANQNDAN